MFAGAGPLDCAVMSPPAPPLVSVVTAVYRPGRLLDRLLASLRAQTLPQDAFEVVLVDDGSPDDETWPYLQQLAAGSENVVVDRIEHSGWPSRPRNVGVRLARGEYVQFVDQDDELFPDGLRGAATFAQQHDLDICSVKEVETGTPAYAIEAFRRSIAGERRELGIRSLVPMVPHKLYRRRMLLDAEVRFPERPRAIWEDIYLNLDAYVAARRIGTYADRAVYRHVVTGENQSLTYLPQREEYWRTVAEVLGHAATVLAADEFTADRRWLIAHHWADRVLRRAAQLAVDGDADARAVAHRYAAEIRRAHGADLAVAELSWRDRRHDVLVRAGDDTALARTAAADSTVVGVSTADELRWDGTELLLTATTRWSGEPGPAVAGPPAAGDLDAVSAVALLRARSGEDTALADTAITVHPASGEGPLPTADVRVRVDVAALPSGAYDVFCRNAALGFVNVRRVRYGGPARVALVRGVAVVAYAGKSSTLAVDVGQGVRSAVNAARPDVEAATATRGLLSIPLGGVHVHGSTVIDGRAVLVPDGTSLDAAVAAGPAGAARLIGDAAGARLEVHVSPHREPRRVAVQFGGRWVVTGVTVAAPSRWRAPVFRAG